MDSAANMVARVLPGYAYYLTPASIGGIYERATDQWVVAAVKRTDEETSALCLLTINADPGQLHAVETPEHLQIGGSCPWEVDGQQVVEQGYHVYPYHLGVTKAAPAGATDIGVGSYGYIAIYEWYDSRGCLHRSRPSPTASITTTTANDVVTIVVPNLWITRKTGVMIVLYRTAVDGSIYYRLKAVANSSAARTQSVTDSYGDTYLTDNEQLYTTGGVLDNEAPPPYRVHCIHQQRHVVVNREAESWDVRYSKQFTPNEGVTHNSLLTIRCDPAGGRITALASFGDRLLIFKEHRIYATHGNGYNLVVDTRSQGYAEPYLVSEAVGCANQKTIVETPSGLLFEGADGIYGLDKTLQVQAVGRPAQYHYEQVTLKSAALVAEQHYALFVSSGSALVYDYLHGQWFTFTNHAATDCAVAQGIYYIKTATGDLVKARNSAAYIDDAAAVAMKIRSGWFSFAGLGGFKRVREILLLGQNVTKHTLRVKTAYDFDPVWIDNQAFPSAGLASYQGASSHYGTGLASGYRDKALLLSVATSWQKCTAIMLEITDEATDPDEGVAQAFALSGISFLVALKDGLVRLGDARQV
jgi:hypothetical protein